MSKFSDEWRVNPLIAVLVVVLTVSLPLTASGSSQPAAWLPSAVGIAGLQLERSDSRGVTFQLAAPALVLDEPATGAAGARGAPCQQVQMPGYVTSAEAGLPALPVKVVLIGVPPNADPKISAEPLSSSAASVRAICPAVTRTVERSADGQALREAEASVADPAVYGADAFYPASHVRLVDLGFMRGQRIVRLEVYPVQYNPVSGALRVAERLQVSLEFGGPNTGPAGLESGAALTEPPGFESAFRSSLLNYEQAKLWRAAAQPVTGAASTAPTAWTPPTPSFKLTVRQTGIYQLTYAYLEAAGLPVGTLDPRTLKLYNQGQELRIRVTGDGDADFEAGEVLLFYGQGIDTRYTDTNVYWLTFGGSQGLRMVEKPSQTGGVQASSFMTSTRFEENREYASAVPKLSGYDHWYGTLGTAPAPSFLHNLMVSKMAATAPTATAELQVQLAAVTIRPHHLRLYVNSHVVLDNKTDWTGGTVYAPTVSFPHNYLVEGANQVKVELVNDIPGFSLESIYEDWLRLSYQRAYSADGDALAFGGDAAGSWQYSVAGFSGSSIEAYDVTDPASPAPITGIATTGAGPYTLSFGATEADPRRYFALATGVRLSPLTITPDTPSNLQSGPGADTIIITYGAFRDAIQPLVDLRSSQGQRVRVVDVQDVYDEFGYGLMSAEAIRDFIAYAYANASWTRPAPSDVLLVGDATYDPRHYLASSGSTYLPSYLEMVDDVIGETATDNRFVAVAGSDVLPDLNIGRLPVNSSAEVAAIVSKILAYEQVSPEQSWTRGVLLVADDVDAGDSNYPAISDAIATGQSPYQGRQVRTLPPPYEPTKIYLGQTCDTVGNPAASVQCRQQIIDRLNSQGALLVSYIGHGQKTYWAAEKLFDAVSVGQLTTGNHLPIMLPMTCMEGYFLDARTGSESLAEAGLRMPNSGAVASWSPTGWGVPSGHDYLERGLFVNMFYGRIAELGAATTAAKLYLAANAPPGTYADLFDTFLLLGDPGLHVPLQALGYSVFLPMTLR